jgi:hypothetical protein
MTTTTTMTTMAGRPLECVVTVRWLTSAGTTARSGACWRCITSDLSCQRYVSPGNGRRGSRGSVSMRGCGAIGTQGGIAWDVRRCRCCHCCRSPDGAGINVTRGIGSGGSAAVVASFIPLLLDGKLLYGGSDFVVVVVPSLQILPPGAGAIVESHLAAIDGQD